MTPKQFYIFLFIMLSILAHFTQWCWHKDLRQRVEMLENTNRIYSYYSILGTEDINSGTITVYGVGTQTTWHTYGTSSVKTTPSERVKRLLDTAITDPFGN